MNSKRKKIPHNTIARLSLYLRELNLCEIEGKKSISSSNLAVATALTDTQVRKDLSHFGQFGISGTGYEVKQLKATIRSILGKDGILDVVLVGAGNLGSALLSYLGFTQEGIRIKHAFDIDTRKIGQTISSVKIRDIETMEELIKKEGIKIAILTVPAFSAQKITEILIKSGIKCVLNFAPIVLRVTNGTLVRNVDLSRELDFFSYFLKQRDNT